jgi:inositol 1,4,5-triphosphate receptor type 3
VSRDNDILDETLKVGSAVLIGGNYEAQECFYQCMIHDEDNKFLVGLKKLLKTNYEKLENAEHQKLSVNLALWRHEKDLVLKGADYDPDDEQLIDILFYQQDQETIETKLKAEEDDTMGSAYYMKQVIQILRFIQLLCENHNGHL